MMEYWTFRSKDCNCSAILNSSFLSDAFSDGCAFGQHR